MRNMRRCYFLQSTFMAEIIFGVNHKPSTVEGKKLGQRMKNNMFSLHLSWFFKGIFLNADLAISFCSFRKFEKWHNFYWFDHLHLRIRTVVDNSRRWKTEFIDFGSREPLTSSFFCWSTICAFGFFLLALECMAQWTLAVRVISSQAQILRQPRSSWKMVMHHTFFNEISITLWKTLNFELL